MKAATLVFIPGSTVKVNQMSEACTAACVRLRMDVSSHAYAVVQNLLLSPWGALHYFDITFTVKTEQELVIHIATRDNNLIN